jgi:hypothetical protein
VATVQRKYEDELIWKAMREAGLSVDEVQVREIYVLIDDERPDPEDGVFRVTFEWTPSHDVAMRILQRARAMEADHPVPPVVEHSWTDDEPYGRL